MNHNLTADEALQRLIEGNQCFLRGEPPLSGVPRETIEELARGQHPFATILGCSDSRVSPETIFHAGLGELFVVRVAGNVLSAEVAGSIQYAGAHLQTPLLVVLGHEGCGAIQAALATMFQGVQQRSRIQLLLNSIVPALDGLDARLPPATQLAQGDCRKHLLILTVACSASHAISMAPMTSPGQNFRQCKTSKCTRLHSIPKLE